MQPAWTFLRKVTVIDPVVMTVQAEPMVVRSLFRWIVILDRATRDPARFTVQVDDITFLQSAIGEGEPVEHDMVSPDRQQRVSGKTMRTGRAASNGDGSFRGALELKPEDLIGPLTFLNRQGVPGIGVLDGSPQFLSRLDRYLPGMDRDDEEQGRKENPKQVS